MKRKDDKFYTKEENIRKLISLVNLKDYDLIIEPSAGDGRFLNYLPQEKTIALDIEPDNKDIMQMDFLKFTLDNNIGKNILVIGNPPFGKNSSLAVKFFNHASKFANTIAFIVPKTFRKESVKNRLHLNFHLVLEEELETERFDYKNKEITVPSIIQIWQRKDIKREKIKADILNDFFMFVKKEDTPDLAVRRVGFYAGKCFKNWQEKNCNTHYFIKVNTSKISIDRVYQTLNAINWEHNNTVGSRSISKGELVENFIKCLRQQLFF